MNKAKLIAVVTIGLLAGVVAGIATRSDREIRTPVLSSAALLSQPRALPDFSLIGSRESVIDGETLRGRWTLVFFGFTNCPDVCPTTLATLSRVVEQLSALERSRTPDVLFISVDPMRDAPEKIQDYVQFFNPAFVGAAADTLTLQSLARAMSVAFEYRPTDNGNDYTVDHTTAILLLNPDANLHAIFTTPHKAVEMTTDLQKIIDAYN